MTVGLHGAALVRDVVRRADDPADALTTIGALEQVTPADVELILHPHRSSGAARVIAMGTGASPGVASAVAVFDADRALDLAELGRPFILVRPMTAPADEPALIRSAGVLTSAGGIASHAAILARSRGLPAVCGAHSLRVATGSFTAGDGTVVHEGDAITIDGTTGEVLVGAGDADVVVAPAELDRLLAWGDDVRVGALGVWANVDTADEAIRARRAGAEGLGLCRTERLLAETVGLDVVRRARVDGDTTRLETALREGYEAVLGAMHGLPVTIRLLDLPFDELIDEHEPSGRSGEHDPMLGVRGVRLSVLEPEAAAASIRALVAAARARARAGLADRVRVMVPFVSTAAEVALVRDQIRSIGSAGSGGSGGSTVPLDIAVGAMVETPRAALVAGEVAEVADFLSIGTNDLTQLTFGLGRDDGARLIDHYVSGGLLPSDPFATIDRSGVGDLVRTAVERARDVDPAIEITVCGEHGGDPASIAFFRSIGVDIVSCSRFRLPVARLAAARAVLGVPS